MPVHPNHNPNAVEDGSSEDFAVVSIATDMAGYRSLIFVAYFRDGMKWNEVSVSSKGQDTTGSGLDPVHAEAISFNVLDGTAAIELYYAACDGKENWCIASTVSIDALDARD